MVEFVLYVFIISSGVQPENPDVIGRYKTQEDCAIMLVDLVLNQVVERGDAIFVCRREEYF